MTRVNNKITNLADILFFDNLALYYVVNDSPPPVLARVFVSGDSRLAGALLGVMNPKQREIIHQLMSTQDDGDQDKNRDAQSALLIIAEGLMERGHLERRGRHVYGVPREAPT